MGKKLVSFCVPCFNSSEYMEKCIRPLASAGDDVEVIIIDDGSKDSTLQIAQNLENEFEGVVKVIHQENKGHGGAIQTAINNSSGYYFKVIDSDDWAELEDVKKLLKTIKSNIKNGKNIDLYIVNYVYERVYINSKIVVNYTKYLPLGKIFSWNEMKKFPQNKVFMMHSLIFKLDVLKKCNLELPEHTFYEDNYFCYEPLPHCQNLYYLDIDFYHYFLGRPDQSCSDENLYKNYKSQMTVTKKIFESYSINDIKKFPKPLAKYMLHVADGMYLLMLIFNAGSKKNLKQRINDYRNIKKELHECNPSLYKHSRLYFLNILLSIRPFFLRRLFAQIALYIRNKLSL